jgi:2-polyprenyl-3-methyl-5-hydroxy-6-metoxy-1,4-benzoquinol methylase
MGRPEIEPGTDGVSIVNRIHAKLHRPDRGWDPISKDYAQKYAQEELGKVDSALLDQLEDWVGGLSGKRVIDLGGGPGHYSVAFAKRGAIVTWHDVSTSYEAIAKQLASTYDVSITFSIGYLDDVEGRFAEQFDLVFNRICWYYGMGDRSFSRAFFSLIRPGGAGYVDTNTSESRWSRLSAVNRVRYWLNNWLWIKIGHPFPPRGRLATLFAAMPIERMHVDYSSPFNDRIWLTRRDDKNSG